MPELVSSDLVVSDAFGSDSIVSDRVVSDLPVRATLTGGKAAAKRGRHARSAGWPCGPCGHENDLAAATCASCGSTFLGGLQPGAAVALRVPLLGDLNRFGRAGLCAIAIGVALFAALIISGLLALVGKAL